MQAHRPSCWTELPAARALLASCRRNPPPLNAYSQHFGLTRDQWCAYSGPRALKLEAIRERHLIELSGADWNAPNPDAAACRRYVDLTREQPSVEQAIDDACAGRAVQCRDYDVSLGGSI